VLQGVGTVAVTPDGKHVYVAGNVVSVIDTATNTVVATVPVGTRPAGIAITPDGKHVYVANNGSNSVSVIETASNIAVGNPITVGRNPGGVGIVPPPPGIPFLAFNAKPVIKFGSVPNHDAFALKSSFTLSSTDSNGINPPAEAVTLQIGTFTATIPPGSFRRHRDGDEDEHEDGVFTFKGVIGGVRLEALIKRTGTLRYAFDAEAKGASLTGTKNPVQVMLTIGDDSGTTSVTARIIQLQARASASP
jgi:YVTN family beta-propeller protein